MATAYTQVMLDALDRAIADGVLTVKFADGKEVTYRDLTSMRRTRGLIARALNAAAGAPKRPRQLNVVTAKGW